MARRANHGLAALSRGAAVGAVGLVEQELIREQVDPAAPVELERLAQTVLRVELQQRESQLAAAHPILGCELPHLLAIEVRLTLIGLSPLPVAAFVPLGQLALAFHGVQEVG